MLPMRNGRHLWKCCRTARTKGDFSCLYQSIDWTQLKPLDGRSCKSMIPVLLDGPPQAVPIETIIETKFDLTLEYHCLRKNGSILGETIFDEGAAILYDQDEKRYRLDCSQGRNDLGGGAALCGQAPRQAAVHLCSRIGALGPAPEAVLRHRRCGCL